MEYLNIIEDLRIKLAAATEANINLQLQAAASSQPDGNRVKREPDVSDAEQQGHLCSLKHRVVELENQLAHGAKLNTELQEELAQEKKYTLYLTTTIHLQRSTVDNMDKASNADTDAQETIAKLKLQRKDEIRKKDNWRRKLDREVAERKRIQAILAKHDPTFALPSKSSMALPTSDCMAPAFTLTKPMQDHDDDEDLPLKQAWEARDKLASGPKITASGSW